MTEDFSVLQKRFGTSDYIVFDPSKVPGYLSNAYLKTINGLMKAMVKRQQWIDQQRHALVSGSIPREAIVKAVIDGEEIKL